MIDSVAKQGKNCIFNSTTAAASNELRNARMSSRLTLRSMARKKLREKDKNKKPLVLMSVKCKS